MYYITNFQGDIRKYLPDNTNKIFDIMQDNSIPITIEVLTDGKPVSLIGKQIGVVLASPSKGIEKITNWSIDREKTNVIKFTIDHNLQDYKGKYKVLIYDDKKLIAETFIIFNHIVHRIIKNGKEYDVIVYPDESVNPDKDLTYSAIANYSINKEQEDKDGKDGISVVSINQIQESIDSLGENIVRVTLSNNLFFDFVIRNGAQGVDGYTPQKGVDYFTETDIANITSAIEGALESLGLYVKPSGGIPKSDLANEVVESLNKADTALQEHQDISGLQPKINNLADIISGANKGATALQPGNLASWAKANTKPTYTASEVGALSNTTTLADLEDATHKTVTPTEKETWNAKQDALTGYAEETFVFTLADDSTVTKTLLVK